MSKQLSSLVVPALIALVSCQAAGASEGAAPSSQAAPGAPEAKSEKDSEAKKAAAKERKAAKKAHDLALARIELEVAELETAHAARGAAAERDSARRDVEEARRALDFFLSRSKPQELAGGRLDLDRAAQRRLEAEQELREMEKTYEKDQFATDTKELVLTRHRKQLEFATRSLELATERHADLEREKLPREQRELEEKLRKAELSLAKAELEHKTTELENRVKLAKARFAITELERPDDDEDDSPKRAESGGKK